jgi:hypothetical protein
MSELRIIEHKSDVEQTLKDAIDNLAPHLQGVLVIGLGKNGEQYLRSSTMSGIEKAFLCQFLNYWMASWFEHRSE